MGEIVITNTSVTNLANKSNKLPNKIDMYRVLRYHVPTKYPSDRYPFMQTPA